jgi:dihydrofolate reductase
MIVTLIAALDEDGVIGRADGGLPWHLPAEVRQFRSRCAGKWLLLGRRTYDEMRGWFADHTPLVLTHRPETITPPGRPVESVAAAVATAAKSGADELMVLGGAEMFALALPAADRMVLSRIHTRSGGEVKFPAFSRDDWQQQSAGHHPADHENVHAFTVTVLERVRRPGLRQQDRRTPGK